MKTLLFAAAAACLLAARAHAHDAGGGVLLASVGALTLRSGALTTARRTAPQPQLACSGSECAHAPSTVRCVNAGLDTLGAVQWTCEATLGEALSFGRVHVSCEGYSRPGDPYVLPGSCSLEYDLVRRHTDARTPHAERVHVVSDSSSSSSSTAAAAPWTGTEVTGAVVTALAFAFVVVVLVSCCMHAETPPPPGTTTHVHMPPQPVAYVGAPYVVQPAAVYAQPRAQPVYVQSATVVHTSSPVHDWWNSGSWGWSGSSYAQGVRDGASAASATTRPAVIVRERSHSPGKTHVAKGYASSSSR